MRFTLKKLKKGFKISIFCGKLEYECLYVIIEARKNLLKIIVACETYWIEF